MRLFVQQQKRCVIKIILHASFKNKVGKGTKMKNRKTKKGPKQKYNTYRKTVPRLIQYKSLARVILTNPFIMTTQNQFISRKQAPINP